MNYYVDQNNKTICFWSETAKIHLTKILIWLQFLLHRQIKRSLNIHIKDQMPNHKCPVDKRSKVIKYYTNFNYSFDRQNILYFE